MRFVPDSQFVSCRFGPSPLGASSDRGLPWLGDDKGHEKGVSGIGKEPGKGRQNGGSRGTRGLGLNPRGVSQTHSFKGEKDLRGGGYRLGPDGRLGAAPNNRRKPCL